MSGPDNRAVIDLLIKGELTVRGQVREASNAVLLCSVAHAGEEASCVYKPVAGERPLWDFPDGTLAQREVAAYELSEATGWGLVPPTVLRDGPYGEGMVQLWIEADPAASLLALTEDEQAGRAGRPSAPPRSARTAPRSSSTPTAPNCADSPSWTRSSTTGTARAGICCPPRTDVCTPSTTV